MKRITAIILTILICFSVTACKNTETQVNSNSETALTTEISSNEEVSEKTETSVNTETSAVSSITSKTDNSVNSISSTQSSENSKPNNEPQYSYEDIECVSASGYQEIRVMPTDSKVHLILKLPQEWKIEKDSQGFTIIKNSKKIGTITESFKLSGEIADETEYLYTSVASNHIINKIGEKQYNHVISYNYDSANNKKSITLCVPYEELDSDAIFEMIYNTKTSLSTSKSNTGAMLLTDNRKKILILGNSFIASSQIGNILQQMCGSKVIVEAQARGYAEVSTYAQDGYLLDRIKSGEFSALFMCGFYGSDDATIFQTFVKHVKYSNSEVGYYRVVMAGTVHVYGVVGYDVATASYYTYTYNVLADDTFEYVDYSKERATFDDCENGVVTFEIPYEVNEYILGVTSETEGLEIGLDGTVNDFEATEDFKGTVVVPQYHAETLPGSDNVALKTKAISSTAFANNTEIKTVILPIYVTEIPEGAFEGCANLETVIAYGVTKIGNDAFKGCTSLKKFYVDNYITELGTNAFENVPEIAVMAHDSNVADAAINSGAKKVTVDVSKITDSFNNRIVNIDNTTDYFAIVGNGGEYTNLQINSNAKETLISKMTFVENSDTPLKINSDVATLSVVSVENSPVYALQLGNDNTDLKLYGEINLSSQGENTVISKNVTLSKANNNITSKLNITGNYLVCGEVVNKESFLNVEPKTITSEEYNMYISPVVLTFDANGGVAISDVKIVYNSQKYGTLPTPQREYFEFIGWYTQTENGELITADSTVNAETSQTLYAQWKQLTSTLIFDANGGSVSDESKLVYIGKTVGDLPTPTRSNFTFLGWFKDDGTQVTNDTVFTATSPVTVKAYWQSGWVKASEAPANAEVADTKYTYTLTSYTTSSSSSLSGWTKYDTTSAWGSYGSWSSWSKTAVSNSDSRQVETKTVTDRAGYTNYKYYIYRTSDGYGYGTQNYYTGSSHGSCTIYDEINLSYSLPVYNSSLGTYGPYNSSKFSHSYDCYWFSGGSSWVPAVTHTEYRYRDRSLVYTYYYKKAETKESVAYPTGDNISNIQEMVQYIAK